MCAAAVSWRRIGSLSDSPPQLLEYFNVVCPLVGMSAPLPPGLLQYGKQQIISRLSELCSVSRRVARHPLAESFLIIDGWLLTSLGLFLTLPFGFCGFE